jgi:hypothetical protein
MTEPTLKIGTTGYKLNPEKLKGASQSVLPYILGCFYFKEEYEYFDVIKPYLDIPEKPKSLDEISQELDEKIDKLIETTKEKFECSKYFAGKRYNAKFDRIIGNFEYAKEHGQFPPKLTYSNLIATGSSLETSFVIKQGSNHKGYYTMGNQRYFRYYMPDKPTAIVKFFMKTCLSLVWVDEDT